jgi:hypothetical protein
MADEVTQVEGSEEHEAEGGSPKNQKVPYERFEEVNQRAKKASQELEDLRTKLIEFEDRDKSEVERERAARERAESQLGELLGKVTALEKGSWVRSAAAELEFHDPEDAVTYLMPKLAGVEDEREAKRLVKKLAESKKHLVRAEEKKERASINRVFAGEQVQPGQNGQANAPQTNQAQRVAQAEQEFAAGLRDQWSKFLPENSDNWYNAGGA